MSRIEIKESSICIREKRPSLFLCYLYFALAFICFLFPISGIIFTILIGNDFHVGFLFGLFFFGIGGFYLLRIALWNTYGVEKIAFSPERVSYVADYGWFQDSAIHFSIQEVRFQVLEISLSKVKLTLQDSKQEVECVTKISQKEGEILRKAILYSLHLYKKSS